MANNVHAQATTALTMVYGFRKKALRDLILKDGYLVPGPQSA